MSLPTLPDATIYAARGGDPEAWSQVFVAFSPAVLGWCRYQGGARIDPEEAAHEVFIRLYERFDKLDGPEHFRAFLYGITRRVVAEHRRRLWWQRWRPWPQIEQVDPGQNPEHHAARTQAARQIETILERVPSRFREVLIHCDVQGRTPREAAELLGLPLNTARSRLARGRDRFRQEAARAGLALEPLQMEEAHV